METERYEELDAKTFYQDLRAQHCMLGARSFTSFAAEAKRRVVVIGGGWSGATAAKYVPLSEALKAAATPSALTRRCAGNRQDTSHLQAALFKEDKRKLDDATAEDIKKK